jgi:hypothetical protein
MIVRRPLAAGVVALALLAAGCGPGEREAGASAAADRFVSTLDSPDACLMLSPDAQKSLAHQGEPCADAVASLDLPHGRVRDATVWSDRAQVHTTDDTLFLVELDTGWRVTAAGCEPAEAGTYECALES